MADWAALTGQSELMLCDVPHNSPFRLHCSVLPHWQVLVEHASAAGFNLQIASAWRGYERQQAIWNAKASGARPVLDASGQPLDIASMTEDELLFAILRWSAIPGCSRHHWGTDLDVYDAAAVSAGYVVQLTPAECTGTGPFAALHCWLDTVLADKQAAFFRPYARDRGGIAPEPWHLSCRVVACEFEQLLDETRLIDWLMTCDLALKHVIYRHWHAIFHRYVRVDAV